MLPLSICCVVFGFCTSELKKTKLKIIVRAYCWLLTVICFASWAVFTVIKLTEMKYSFTSVTYLFLDTVRIIMLTYYRVKFLVRDDVISDVFKRIDYADKCLERIGIKVPHKRNQIECVAYSIVILLMSTIFLYLRGHVPGRWLHDNKTWGKAFSAYTCCTKSSASKSCSHLPVVPPG